MLRVLIEGAGNRPIVIGLHDKQEMHEIYRFLFQHGRDDLVELLADGYEVYDMTNNPDRGDGLDAITERTPLVVAVNLYGISVRSRADDVATSAYFYNRNNHELLALCKRLSVPLVAWGEVPEGSDYAKLYTW
tara:strand:- start:2587 stop:2985 length:399 start_codon:yes stop_codon:yes gene_type:complete